jgi:hypothetical protein
MTKTKSFWFLSSLFFIMLPMLWNYRSIISAPNTEWILEGRVYEGNQGEITRPLQGAWIEVYGVYGAYPTTGTLLRMVTTDAAGWYGISVYDTDGPFTHYYILAVDRPGYTSVSATTVGGLVRTANWIEYEAPLAGKTWTGNIFWDRAPVLSGRVYEGNPGVEDRPLAGVRVELYCSPNPYPALGDLLVATETNQDGWYGLSTYIVYAFCDFYHIIQVDQPSYYSSGATTVSGKVQTDNWIEYVSLLTGKTFTGNKFWDDTNHVYLPLVRK